MDMKSVCLCVIILSIKFVRGQYANSPCPDVFNYVDDGQQQVYGKIILRPTGRVTSVILRVNFTVAAQLFSNYVGQLDADDSTHLLQNYNQGQAVSYRIHFPVTSPLPKLTAVTVNDNVICYGPGDIPRPNTYVTTLSLQHTSFLQGVPGPVYNNFLHQPQTRPQQPQVRPQQPQAGPQQQPSQNHVQYGDDGASALVYTFNNIEPTWSTGNSPYYVVNDSSPYSPPTQYQPSTQQVFQSSPVHDQYNQIVPNQGPPQSPNTPVYELATRRPAETAVTRPNTNDIIYSDRSPQTPPPVITAGPTQQRFSETPVVTVECGVVAGGNERVPLVYNGNAYTRGDLPWLVAMFKSEGASLRFICGGTLVSDRHVVSAAHCMQRRGELTSFEDIVIKAGVHNLKAWSDDITVTRQLKAAAIHENYNLATLENDILVVTLNKRVVFNTYIRPACLWADDPDLSRVVGDSGVVAGWGDQGPGHKGSQGEPHMVRIPIVSTNDCRASKPTFHELTYESTLCAGDRKGSGPCVGDSGGGLYIIEGGKWRLRGVVSVSLRAANGDNTCNLDEYVVFTDAAKFLPWIRNILSEKHFD